MLKRCACHDCFFVLAARSCAVLPGRHTPVSALQFSCVRGRLPICDFWNGVMKSARRCLFTFPMLQVGDVKKGVTLSNDALYRSSRELCQWGCSVSSPT